MKEKSSLLQLNAKSLEMMEKQRERERKIISDFVIQQSHTFQRISCQPNLSEPFQVGLFGNNYDKHLEKRFDFCVEYRKFAAKTEK